MSLTTEDKSEIVELAAKYCHALDSGDARAVVDLFVDSGRFDGLKATFTGKDELTAFFTANIEKDDNERHFTSNHLVDGNGTNATHRCYYQVAFRGSHGIKATGLYYDDLVKLGDAWRFKRRRVVPDRT